MYFYISFYLFINHVLQTPIITNLFIFGTFAIKKTLANVYLALENDLEIIPVLNKIDLPAAEPDRVATEIEDTIGLDTTNIVQASAKAGIGIEDILESVIRDVPPPAIPVEGAPLRALIFDSLFDSFRGVIVFFRVVDGEVKRGDKIRFFFSGAEYEVTEVGIMQPQQIPVTSLRAGEVGYICASIKSVSDARVGDTIMLSSEYKRALSEQSEEDRSNPEKHAIQPLPGCECFLWNIYFLIVAIHQFQMPFLTPISVFAIN